MSGVQRGLRTLTLVGRCGFGAKQMTRTLSLKSGIFIPSLNIRFPRPNLVLHRCGNHYPGQILHNETFQTNCLCNAMRLFERSTYVRYKDCRSLTALKIANVYLFYKIGRTRSAHKSIINLKSS